MISFDSRKRFPVPNAAMRARQVQVKRRALAQVRRDLSPVHLDHAARLIEDRNHDRAVQVLVPALAKDPDARERRSKLGAAVPRARRKPIGQRAVRKARA